MERQSTKLRKLMQQGVVVAPGSWDALSAKMVENAGFQAVYMSGMGVSMSLIGRPDLGYINQTEMLQSARHITDIVNIPVISDIDDGFGNPLDVQRTIILCQKMGLAGAHMEDMERPKRCAHIGGARLAPAELMVNKIKAAIEAKYDPDFVLIARTDNYEGVDELIRRAKLYAAAGADLIMPIALHTKEDYERAAREIPIPMLDGPAGGMSSPQLSVADCKRLNFKIQTFGLEGFAQAYQGQLNFLKRLNAAYKKAENTVPLDDTFTILHEYENVLGLKHDEAAQTKYFPPRES